MAEEYLDDNPGGSGRAALAGYDYQMDVSVWLALVLVVANKQASELVLEPATQEDIEGTLEQLEPGRVTGEVRLGATKLVVQAKLRGGDAWSVNAIQTLLKYGGKNWVSAAQRLADPEVHYPPCNKRWTERKSFSPQSQKTGALARCSRFSSFP